MLDRISLRLAKPLLESFSSNLYKYGISADQVSIIGFICGMLGAAAIVFHFYLAAIFLILLNRIADGLDGALARKWGATDSGAYLDICLDFIFYSAVVFAFCLAEPEQNGLAGAALIFSFVGTGTTFLAYAIMAERRNLTNLRLPDKGFYYLGGIAEGTETIIFFIICCLFPGIFSLLAWIFAGICALSTGLRILYAYSTLKIQQAEEH